MVTFSTRHERLYTALRYRPGDALVFGSESVGLDEPTRTRAAPEHRLRLPMLAGRRSINLSNAVAIAVYEAWRQNAFATDRFAADHAR